MKYSLSKAILGSEWVQDGIIAHPDGQLSKAFVADPFPIGLLEENLDGAIADNFFMKLSDLLSKLPNSFEGQILLARRKVVDSKIAGFQTKLYFFESVKKAESYSHIGALLSELGIKSNGLTLNNWQDLLSGYFGNEIHSSKLPDVVWEKDCISVNDQVVRVLSLTELPQLTWKGCLQPIFESPFEFTLSLKYAIPDRNKIKRQLETKRRVNHALSVTSSAEVRNIESNSLLSSSEETLERILVGKETLFEISYAAILLGDKNETENIGHEFERVISGIGNAGLFLEGVGVLPVFKSHIPGNRVLGIRKLPVLSENLAHLMPLLHDYSRLNDKSNLELRSRSGEVSYLNLFSKENLNYNSFICGASGSGKSFLMNAFLTSNLKDEPRTRLCIFDIGGSYRKIIEAGGGKSKLLSSTEARALLSSFLKTRAVDSGGFFRILIETLCGSGSHITHSHKVAIDDLLKQIEGHYLHLGAISKYAAKKDERFYQDIAH